jgi:hypothetical protein
MLPKGQRNLTTPHSRAVLADKLFVGMEDMGVSEIARDLHRRADWFGAQ